MNEPVVALVVAAGSGSRLGAPVPKALVEVAGRPLVVRSVEALAAGGCTSAVVVAPSELVGTFTTLLADAPVPVRVVAGGDRRQDSVANGLAAIDVDEAVVLVHDAARPFVPSGVVAEVIAQVSSGAVCAIPTVPVVDSIRGLDADGSHVVDRSSLVAVQTPQGFSLSALRRAHQQVRGDGVEYTDDAAVCEAVGHRVVLVPGSRDSMKITEPLDMVLAEAIAARRAL